MRSKITKKNTPFLIVSISILIFCGIYLYNSSVTIKESMVDQKYPVYGLAEIDSYLANNNAKITKLMTEINAGFPNAGSYQPRIVMLVERYRDFLYTLQEYCNTFFLLLVASNDTNKDYLAYRQSLQSIPGADKEFGGLLSTLYWILSFSISKTTSFDKVRDRTDKATLKKSDNLTGLLIKTIMKTQHLPLISVPNTLVSYGTTTNPYIIALQKQLQQFNELANLYSQIVCSSDYIDPVADGTSGTYDVEYAYLDKFHAYNLKYLLERIRNRQNYYSFI